MRNLIAPALLVLSLVLLFSACKKSPVSSEPPTEDDHENPINEVGGKDAIILTGNVDADSVLTDVFDDPLKADYKIVDSLFINAKMTARPGVVIFSTGAPIYIRGSLNLEQDVKMVLNSNLVEVNGSLSIEPGSEMRLGGGSLITVFGTLLAEGTKTDSVKFTSSDKTDLWRGMLTGPNSQISLNYADISYAGSDGGGQDGVKSGLRFLGGTLSIENSRIHHNEGYGIYLNVLEKAITSFSNNTFNNNSLAGVSLMTINVGSLEKDNRFKNNGVGAVEIRGSQITKEALSLERTPETWPALSGSAYLVNEDLLIWHKVTLAPGTHFKMAEGVGWQISGDGTLIAEGTSDL
jgi:hypothetical protein